MTISTRTWTTPVEHRPARAARARVRAAAGGQGGHGRAARLGARPVGAAMAAVTVGSRRALVHDLAPGRRSRRREDGRQSSTWHVRVEPRRARRASSWSLSPATTRRSWCARRPRPRRVGRPGRCGGDPRARSGGSTPRSATSTRCAWRCPTSRTTSSSPPARRGSSPSSDETRSGRHAWRCRSIAGSRHPPCACWRGCRATASDAESAEQPGKILHELRGDAARDARRGHRCCRRCTTAPSTRRRCGCACSPTRGAPGMPEDEVRELLPALRARAGLAAAPRRQRRRRLHRLHRRDRARPREPGLEGLGRFPMSRRTTGAEVYSLVRLRRSCSRSNSRFRVSSWSSSSSSS